MSFLLAWLVLLILILVFFQVAPYPKEKDEPLEGGNIQKAQEMEMKKKE